MYTQYLCSMYLSAVDSMVGSNGMICTVRLVHDSDIHSKALEVAALGLDLFQLHPIVKESPIE